MTSTSKRWTPPSGRSAGILYEVWHSEAATAMAEVKARGLPVLTTERVIRSNGTLQLADVFPAAHGPFSSADIYNVEPAVLGFYCLSSKRTANDSLPDCPMRQQVARRHAQMLVSAGFDYIAVDITNWPQVNAATDVAILRPLENLFDEWLTMRAEGLSTPLIATWAVSPVATYTDGHQTTWQWILDHVYNNATRQPLLWRRPNQQKKTLFLPQRSDYNETVAQLIRSNGGRNDIDVVGMWALSVGKGSTAWGFFAPCTTPAGAFTTSMVGVDDDCNQFPALTSASSSGGGGGGVVEEISASGGYMLNQCSLPFASPGHLRGLTLQRLFKQVLEAGAPNLFVSSFNEHFGGRQAPASGSDIAFNMGLPDDAQRNQVWVDTYGAEFSRDLEPSVEGGSRIWEVASACVQLYKAGKTCASSSSSSSPCCTTDDKLVYGNAWSLTNAAAGDALVTASRAERDALLKAAGGAWKEVCNPIAGPTVFCVDGSMKGGRNGPFMLMSTPNATMAALPGAELVPLYRCLAPATTKHYMSARADCEGLGKQESVLGYMSSLRGYETLRALRRCGGGSAAESTGWSHALDLGCEDGGPGVLLGFVR
eukprot:g1965.t1